MPQVLELQIDCVFKDVKKQGARDCSCERVTCIVIVRSLIVIWVTDVFDGLPNLQLLEWLERRQGADVLLRVVCWLYPDCVMTGCMYVDRVCADCMMVACACCLYVGCMIVC